MITNGEYKQRKQEGTLLRVDWRHIVSRRRDEYARSCRDSPEQIPTNGRKSKCCIVIRRYRAVLPGPPYSWQHAGVRNADSTKVGFCGRNGFRPRSLSQPRRAARKGSHPPTFSTSAGRDVWLNNRTDELKRAMKCMTCVSADGGCITMRNVVKTRDTGHPLLWNVILPAGYFIGYGTG